MTWFFIDVKEVHFSLIDVVNLCMKEKRDEWNSNCTRHPPNFTNKWGARYIWLPESRSVQKGATIKP